MAQFDHGGGLSHVVAAHGYVIGASRWEDEVVFVDLEPLLGSFRRAYLEDVDYCNENVGPVHVWSPNPAPDQFAGDERWPFSFAVAPESMPVVAGSIAVPHPRDVLAGMQWRDESDVPKAYALADDGRLFVIAPNRVFSQHPDAPPTSTEDPSVLLEFPTCEHPTTMQFLRGAPTLPVGTFPGVEMDVNVNARNAAPLIACRGDRMLQAIATYGDQATVLWELQDQALGDPVGLDLSERGPIVTVADFDGASLVNYQVGDIVGQGCPTNDYPVMPTGDLAIHRGGVMTLPGPVHQITSSNVN